MLELLQMWLVVEVLGIICLPLTIAIFHNLPDRGWAFSKAIGVALLAWCTWFPLMWLPTLPYNRLFIAGVALMLLIGGIAGHQYLLASLKKLLRVNIGYLLACEAIFLGMVFLLGWLRSYTPQIDGFEMFMDEAFISGIMRSPHLPPHDTWFTGFPINYYYYAHFVIATLAKLLGQSPSIAFNTGICIYFGLTALALFGVTCNIVGWARYARGLDQAPANEVYPPLLKSLPYGFLTILMGLVMGNLAATKEWFDRHGDISGYDWFSPTRVIEKTINEFPACSFLLACFHAHVLTLAFTILAIALAFNLFLQSHGRGLGAFGRIWQYPISRTPFLTNSQALITFFITVLVLGGLYVMNSWDFPTYAGLTLVCIITQQWLAHGLPRADWRLWVRFALSIASLSVALIAWSILLYTPFWLRFISPSNGIGILKPDDRSSLGDEALIYGIFAFIFFSLLVVALIKRFAHKPEQSPKEIQSTSETHTNDDKPVEILSLDTNTANTDTPTEEIVPATPPADAESASFEGEPQPPEIMTINPFKRHDTTLEALGFDPKTPEPQTIINPPLLQKSFAWGKCRFELLVNVEHIELLFAINPSISKGHTGDPQTQSTVALATVDDQSIDPPNNEFALVPATMNDQPIHSYSKGTQSTNELALQTAGDQPTRESTNPQRGHDEPVIALETTDDQLTPPPSIDPTPKYGRDRLQPIHKALASIPHLAIASKWVRQSSTYLDIACIFLIFLLGLIILLRVPNSLTFVVTGTIAAVGFVLACTQIRERSLAFTLLLGASAFALVAGCEIIFMRDVFADNMPRMNTVFKFYFQAWALLSIACGAGLFFIPQAFYPLTHAPWGVRLGLWKVEAIWYFFFIALLLAGAAYPQAGAYTRTGKFEHRSNNLDGLDYLKESEPGNYAAIRWLNSHVQGDPVILECIGDDYSHYSRVSTFTGLPTVMGWVGHELQWRLKWLDDKTQNADFFGRGTDIKNIYTGTDPDEVRKLLDKYQISYVYLGDLENKQFPLQITLQDMTQLFQEVYSSQGVTIYQVIR